MKRKEGCLGSGLLFKLAASNDSEAALEKVKLALMRHWRNCKSSGGSCFQAAQVDFPRLGYQRSKVERLEPANANVNGDRGGAMRETNLEQQPGEVGSDANCCECEGMWEQREVSPAMMMEEAPPASCTARSHTYTPNALLGACSDVQEVGSRQLSLTSYRS